MTEQEFKDRSRKFCTDAIARGFCTADEFCEAIEVDLVPPMSNANLRAVFRDCLMPFILTEMRARWGAAEQLDIRGQVAARALIPIDQFVTKAMTDVPAPTLARAARKYFDE